MGTVMSPMHAVSAAVELAAAEPQAVCTATARRARLAGVSQQALLRGICMPALQDRPRQRIDALMQQFLPVVRWWVQARGTPPLKSMYICLLFSTMQNPRIKKLEIGHVLLASIPSHASVAGPPPGKVHRVGVHANIALKID